MNWIHNSQGYHIESSQQSACKLSLACIKLGWLHARFKKISTRGRIAFKIGVGKSSHHSLIPVLKTKSFRNNLVSFFKITHFYDMMILLHLHVLFLTTFLPDVFVSSHSIFVRCVLKFRGPSVFWH